MIAFIRGNVVYKEDGQIVIDNRGVGYRIRVPDHVLSDAVEGQELMLHTHLQVREDGMSLFGFSSRKELELFGILLGINGVGPKAGLALLSTLGPEELYFAVFSDDVKAITRTPGIGPKGAKRIILELKDKLDINEITAGLPEGEEGGPGDGTAAASAIISDAVNDAISALLVLGFSSSDAYRAIHAIPDAQNMDVETLIREALRRLG